MLPTLSVQGVHYCSKTIPSSILILTLTSSSWRMLFKNLQLKNTCLQYNRENDTASMLHCFHKNKIINCISVITWFSTNQMHAILSKSFYKYRYWPVFCVFVSILLRACSAACTSRCWTTAAVSTCSSWISSWCKVPKPENSSLLSWERHCRIFWWENRDNILETYLPYVSLY